MTSVRCFVLVMVVILIQSEVSFLQWKLTYVQKVTVRFFVSEVFFFFVEVETGMFLMLFVG